MKDDHQPCGLPGHCAATMDHYPMSKGESSSLPLVVLNTDTLVLSLKDSLQQESTLFTHALTFCLQRSCFGTRNRHPASKGNSSWLHIDVLSVELFLLMSEETNHTTACHRSHCFETMYPCTVSKGEWSHLPVIVLYTDRFKFRSHDSRETLPLSSPFGWPTAADIAWRLVKTDRCPESKGRWCLPSDFETAPPFKEHPQTVLHGPHFRYPCPGVREGSNALMYI